MKKKQRIKKNKEFTYVFKQGRSVANRQFVLYVCRKDEQTNFRLGLSINKRVGNAVTRNRVKRYIREVFRMKQEHLAANYDYVVIARRPTANMTLSEVESSLLHVMRKAGILISKKVVK